MIRQDDYGQWILLSAVIIAFGMGTLIFLLNTAMMSGHSSADAVMSVPKDRIRDLRYQTVTEAMIIGNDTNWYSNTNDPQVITDKFNTSYDKFLQETSGLYLNHGIIVNVDRVPNYNIQSGRIDNISLTILYNDGNSIYIENTTVGVGG